MSTDPFDRAVDLYRAETDQMMRDHFFRTALLRLGPTQLANLIEALIDPSIDQLRKSLTASAGRLNGRCSWCGGPMPVPERPQGGGRTKLYCSDAHKQAAHRAAREANSGPGDQAT